MNKVLVKGRWRRRAVSGPFWGFAVGGVGGERYRMGRTQLTRVGCGLVHIQFDPLRFAFRLSGTRIPHG